MDWDVAFKGVGAMAGALLTFLLNKKWGKGAEKEAIDRATSSSGVDKERRILFVDDDTKFKVVKIIKQAGWQNVKIAKDITHLTAPDVKDADILFIDIQGVGKAMQFADEGLGLAAAIKKKYPQKKVVIYSAQTTGERFHEALRQADYSLPKNAEPYEFIQTVERLSQVSK